MVNLDPHYDPILHDLLEIFPAERGLMLPPELDELGFLVGGWFSHVHNGITAIALLTQNNLGNETAALRRSVVEHTVALKWIRFEGSVVLQTVVRKSTEGILRTNKATQEAYGASIPQDVIDQMQLIADGADKSNDFMGAFANRIKKLTGKVEYADYLQETQLAHPSGGSALMYMTDVEKYVNHRSQASFCCMYLLYALEHLNNIFVPKPWPNLLKTYSARIEAASRAADRETS